MVIDGNRVFKDVFTFVEFEGDRIRLPQRFVEAAQLSGTDPVDRLLFVIKPGAYRLLPQTDGSPRGELHKTVTQWEEAGQGAGPLEKTDGDKWAGIRARLIPCVVSPRGPGWRIHLPKVAKQLADGDSSGVFLLIIAASVELWFPAPLKQALSGPISERFE